MLPSASASATPSPTDDARGEASGEGRGWCAMLRLQDAQPNAWQGRLRQQWRQIPAKGCRVGRREGAAMMPPLGRRPASVRSTRPSLQLELQHHLRHRTSSWQTVQVSAIAQTYSRRDLPRATLHHDSIASAAALAAVPAATASLAGAFFTTWLTTWLTTPGPSSAVPPCASPLRCALVETLAS